MGPSEHYLRHAWSAALAATPGPRRDNDLAVIGYSLARHGPAQDAAHPDRLAALDRFATLTARHPDYAMGWFNAGYANWSEGRRQQAAACFARAHDLLQGAPDSFDPWALYNHEQHHEPHGFKKACNDALFDLVRSGSDARARALVAASALYFLARFQESCGFLFEAYDLLCGATDLDPGRGEFARAAAIAADVLGYDGEALRHYERGVDLLPLDVEWRLRFVGFLARARLLERAKEELVAAVDLLRATKGSEALREHAKFLAAALSHLQCATPALAGLLLDQFAVAALPQLCTKVAETRDPRLEARIGELLAAQGKDAAAARWAAQCRRERQLSPGAAALLAAHRARSGAQSRAGAAPV
jgi:tetratricopeptide (TPR) repeat protein